MWSLDVLLNIFFYIWYINFDKVVFFNEINDLINKMKNSSVVVGLFGGRKKKVWRRIILVGG